MSQLNTIGKVILAGAGPGDPELITLKLQLRLEDAEVIIVDRLVNPAIIEAFANEDALVLMTGKQGYHDGSVAQEDINKLLVKYALDGKTVLRENYDPYQYAQEGMEFFLEQKLSVPGAPG